MGPAKPSEEVVHWATLNAARDADVGFGHYVGTLLDIGDHKRSEVCLRAHGRTRHAPRR